MKAVAVHIELISVKIGLTLVVQLIIVNVLAMLAIMIAQHLLIRLGTVGAVGRLERTHVNGGVRGGERRVVVGTARVLVVRADVGGVGGGVGHALIGERARHAQAVIERVRLDVGGSIPQHSFAFHRRFVMGGHHLATI